MRVCHSHILRCDIANGERSSVRPRVIVRIKDSPLLNRDCLLRNGIKQVSADGPGMINLRKMHRE